MLLADLSEEDKALIADDDLGFEVPINFIAQNYEPEATDHDFLSRVPDIIFGVIRSVLPMSNTIDPITPFYCLKTGKLPMWVVKWFIQSMRPSRFGNATLFYRSMYLIEQLRAFTQEVISEEEVLKDLDLKAFEGHHASFEEEEEDTLRTIKRWEAKEQAMALERDQWAVVQPPMEDDEPLEPEDESRKRKHIGKGKGKGKRSKKD